MPRDGLVSDLPYLPAVSTGRRSAVRWDEANLEANEEIKRDLNPTKITEPKTPYRSPLATDDELDLEGSGVLPLRLEDGAGPSSADGSSSIPRSPHRTAAAPAPILITKPENNGSWSDSDRSTGRSPGMNGRSPRFSRDTYWAEGDVEAADPERQLKRQKFREARRKHYNLKMSLKEAHDLVAKEEEEDDGEAGGPEQG